VSQIDVSDLHDAVVLLEGDATLLHVGEDNFLERLQSYVDLAPALHERVPDIDYVDLRFNERVYLRPGATGKPSSSDTPVAKK
jgi:cell division septal protein FtsQ